jgi:hypothetical protein
VTSVLRLFASHGLPSFAHYSSGIAKHLPLPQRRIDPWQPSQIKPKAIGHQSLVPLQTSRKSNSLTSINHVLYVLARIATALMIKMVAVLGFATNAVAPLKQVVLAMAGKCLCVVTIGYMMKQQIASSNI